MARRSEFYTQLGDGPNAISIGYSSKPRGGHLAVTFVGPDGNRLEKVTPCKRKDANFHIECAKLIVRAYQKTNPDISRVGWDDAYKEVERTAAGHREKTLLAFRKAIKMLRSTLADEKIGSPVDITPELAMRFAKLFMGTTYKRGKAKDAKVRKRSPVTLDYYRRSLSALWNQFQELGYVKNNPWSEVRRPKLDKKSKTVPTEDETTKFLAWVRERYPEWERLDLLLQVKLLSGCRTHDIVQLRTGQLSGGELHFAADQVKNKEGRSVPLPTDLLDRLKVTAGKVWLWDGWNADCLKFRPSANNHKLAGGYDPDTVYAVLCNIFREYSDQHPDRPRLTPHSLRRRAITMMTLATGSVDLTAQALGINPQTARSYYLDAQRAFNTKDAFKLATGLLLPSQVPTAPPVGLQDGSENQG